MKSIGPENTRVRKVVQNGKPILQLLQASVETDPLNDNDDKLADGILLVRGDYSEELTRVCIALERAKEYASNDKQTRFLTQYIEFFRTGSLEAFQESQKTWMTDASARVESIIGFIEPYRDPAGIHCDWEAMVGIADDDEIQRLKKFVDNSTIFIRQLPWAVVGVNDGKGPFERTLFEAPDFTSVHGWLMFEHKETHANSSSARRMR